MAPRGGDSSVRGRRIWRRGLWPQQRSSDRCRKLHGGGHRGGRRQLQPSFHLAHRLHHRQGHGHDDAGQPKPNLQRFVQERADGHTESGGSFVHRPVRRGKHASRETPETTPVLVTVNDPNYSGMSSGTLRISKATPLLSGITATAITQGQTLSASTITGTAKNARGG